MLALESDAPLIVYVDIKSPYAFVALRPTFELEAALGLQFDWRPLTLDIPSYLGSARKSKGKIVQSDRTPASWRAVKYAYMDTRRYAQRQGYVLKGTEKIWDTRMVSTAILWVSRQDRSRIKAFFETVYPAFWRRELDVEALAVVKSCIETAGVDSRGFDQFLLGEGGVLHDDLQAQLHPSGIYGVPTYVCEGEILFGREQLPYVKWILQGRRGDAPDVGNPL
mgnify:CR=1 FL=1